MSSSPIHAAVSSDHAAQILNLLGRVPDPWDPRGVRYPLCGMLAVAVAAVLTGARSFAAIWEWAADLSAQGLARLGLTRAPESVHAA